MFLKQKRDGTIKGIGCADGRKQRLWQDTSAILSPTVSTKTVFLTCIIDVKEGRGVATADLPGFFLQTKQEEEVLIKLSGAAALLLVESDPGRWKKHLVLPY